MSDAMTPTEHYWEAERLIAVGESVVQEIRDIRRKGVEDAAWVESRRDALGKQAMGIWAQAQVHATLALHPGGA
jgi:hypothetical protein